VADSVEHEIEAFSPNQISTDSYAPRQDVACEEASTISADQPFSFPFRGSVENQVQYLPPLERESVMTELE
jgi:hypothetical protein